MRKKRGSPIKIKTFSHGAERRTRPSPLFLFALVGFDTPSHRDPDAGGMREIVMSNHDIKAAPSEQDERVAPAEAHKLR